MGGLGIRAAHTADLGRITEIYDNAVRNGTASYELEPPSVDEMTSRFSALRGGGYPYLVAEMANAVVGYAYVGPFRPRPAYRFMVEDSIYIASEAQGRGIGGLLLTALLDKTRALGFRQIAAVIGDGSRESPSVRLHKKLGFRHCGVLAGSGFKHGRWLDTVLMQLALNGGADAPPDPNSLPEKNFRQSR